MNISVTDKLQGNQKFHGQKFINKSLSPAIILEKLAKNLDQLDFADDNYKKKIYDSIKLNGELNFDLSNQEIQYCYNIQNPQTIFNYLAFRYKFKLASSQKEELDVPPYLLIEPVSACNLRCPMCFQIDKTFTRKPFMGVIDWDFFKRIVQEANDIGVGAITLASRGEPSMHPKYGEMIEFVCKQKNIFEKKTNTNATFLNEKICHQVFDNDLTTIVISADHYEKEQYEILRKGANFEKIIKNVEMLHNIREKYYPGSNTEIRVSGVDYHKNLDRNKFEKFWIQFSDNVSASFAIERWDTYNNPPHEDINSACSYLWDRMYVWFDGLCNPCDEDYKSYLSYGNLKNNSIKEVWNSKDLKIKRQKHLFSLRNQLTPCDRCGVCFDK
tara:strand:- start:498 stop:1652 length:1155 start_codon:yes stop_codon:yes gene_type:complete